MRRLGPIVSYIVEDLEQRCLLTTTGMSPSQAAVLAGVPAQLQGKFVGTQLELSHAPSAGVATPTYALLDIRPTLTADDQLAPFSTTGPTGMTAAKMRHAYGVDNIQFGSVTGDGTGQTIAIIDAYDYPTAATDLAGFDAAFGLPAELYQGE